MKDIRPIVKLHVDLTRSLFKVPRRSFVDADVFEAERQAIFNRCWLYLAHVSEVAKPGQFVTRTVAGRNLIFNRDTSGRVNALMNTCPHRGATVCRERGGTAKSFQCFYHGWVFGSDGALKSQPGQESYCEGFNRSGDANLVPAPCLAEYRGFYFIAFDKDIVDLPTYLGNAREYLDIVADHAAGGMAILGGTQEYSIRANWKLLVENSIDGYHAATTHASYLDYLKGTAGALAAVPLSGIGRDLGNGHAVVEYAAPWGRPIGQWIPAWGEEGKADVAQRVANLTERFGAERAQRIALKNRNLLIFPNLIVNDIMAITVRTFYPLGTDSVNINAWTLAPVDEGPGRARCVWRTFSNSSAPEALPRRTTSRPFSSASAATRTRARPPGTTSPRGWPRSSRPMTMKRRSAPSGPNGRRALSAPMSLAEGAGAMQSPQASFTRSEIEDFLFEEAALLDDWRLDEWLALYTADAHYQVPATDLPRDAQPESSLFYIADDAFRLSERVKRLMKKTAFSEQPRSKTRHLVSNVRILENGAAQCRVGSAFVTYRTKGGVTDTYIGSTEHTLLRSPTGLRIAYKRCTLDLETLRPQGRISILL